MRIDWRPTVQLTFSGRQNSEKKRRIPEAAAAVLLGAALFRFLVSAFGLHWSPANAFSVRAISLSSTSRLRITRKWLVWLFPPLGACLPAARIFSILSCSTGSGL